MKKKRYNYYKNYYIKLIKLWIKKGDPNIMKKKNEN